MNRCLSDATDPSSNLNGSTDINSYEKLFPNAATAISTNILQYKSFPDQLASIRLKKQLQENLVVAHKDAVDIERSDSLSYIEIEIRFLQMMISNKTICECRIARLWLKYDPQLSLRSGSTERLLWYYSPNKIKDTILIFPEKTRNELSATYPNFSTSVYNTCIWNGPGLQRLMSLLRGSFKFLSCPNILFQILPVNVSNRLLLQWFIFRT